MTSARKHLAEFLKPKLPKHWILVPYEISKLDVLAVPTVVIKTQTFEPAPHAPSGALKTSLIVTVIDPATDERKAEEALEDEVLELIFLLDSYDPLIFESAQHVMWNKTNQAWDITLTAYTKRKD